VQVVEYEHDAAPRGQPPDDPLQRIVDGVEPCIGSPEDAVQRELDPLPEVGAPVVVAIDGQPRDVAAPNRP
jgi:hypothetical protein